MKKVLVHSQADQVRLAIVDDGRLVDFTLHDISKPKTKSNIYFGKVFRVENGLESAFVDYGATRHGFLPFKEVNQPDANQALHKHQKIKDITLDEGEQANDVSVAVESPLTVGESLIVQVVKEERGNKGAALTGNISLAGKYLVFMPYGNSSGISRRVSPEDRTRLKQILETLTVPTGSGVILRTAGASQSKADIQSDLDSLVRYWQKIQEAIHGLKAPVLLAEESSFYFSLLRDYISNPDISSILLDSAEGTEECKNIASLLFGQDAHKIEHFASETPIFQQHGVEAQLAQLFQREVRLPSGGSIVIDPTEALTSIDVNSAQAIRANNIEDTAFNTNLEAATEIANQLRFRDIGGLIVIDFIDMKIAQNRKKVVERVEEQTKVDRARIQIGDMSRFGLLEMSRQHLGSALHDMMPVSCPHCHGSGKLLNNADLANAIWQDALKASNNISAHNTIEITLAPHSADALNNDKRAQMSALETENTIHLVIKTNPEFGQQDYTIDIVDEQGVKTLVRDTRTLMKHQKKTTTTRNQRVKPAVDFRDLKPESAGLWAWIKHIFVATEAEPEPATRSKKTNARGQNTERRAGAGGSGNNRRGGHNRRGRGGSNNTQDNQSQQQAARDSTREATTRDSARDETAREVGRDTTSRDGSNRRSGSRQQGRNARSNNNASKTSTQQAVSNETQATPVQVPTESAPKKKPHAVPSSSATSSSAANASAATAPQVATPVSSAPAESAQPRRAPNDPRQQKEQANVGQQEGTKV